MRRGRGKRDSLGEIGVLGDTSDDARHEAEHDDPRGDSGGAEEEE